jgi:hypothetical protein
VIPAIKQREMIVAKAVESGRPFSTLLQRVTHPEILGEVVGNHEAPRKSRSPKWVSKDNLHCNNFKPRMTGVGHFRQIDPLPTLSACPLRSDRVRTFAPQRIDAVSSAIRFALVTARARRRPSLICAAADGIAANATRVCPPTSDCTPATSERHGHDVELE